MNTKKIISFLILSFVGLIISTFFVGYQFALINNQQIELPEEYKSINQNDTIKAYFTNDSILVIEFNNKKNRLK